MKFVDYIDKALKKMGISQLTEIQQKVIPILLRKQNVIAVSHTGTGKTLAYCLPILQNINLDLNEIQALIISPTRELATQIKNVLSLFEAHEKKLKINLLIGGLDFDKKVKQIQKKPGQILVATPSRLLTAFKYGLNINLDKFLKYVVYDEADMFIDDTFWQEFAQIKKRFSKANLTEIVLSATLHQDLISKFKKIISNPKIIDITDTIWINKKINHFLITSASNNKLDNLEAIVKQIKPYLCLIFVNNHKDIYEIQQWFVNQKITPIVLHGKLMPNERKQAFKKIIKLESNYVITTDLAARGLDVDGVSHIISWNLPKDDIWYIHRSGRTSRSKYTGESYVMYDSKDDQILKRLSKKGIIWIPMKVNKIGDLIKHKLIYKKTVKNKIDPKYEKEFKKLNQKKITSKVQPNYKKKVKLKKHKLYQKMKHEAIEKKIKENLLKKYKMQKK